MWFVIEAIGVIIGLGFIYFFGKWTIKRGWYDD
jgi:hypothetical protein